MAIRKRRPIYSVRKVANVEDQLSGNSFEEFEFLKPHGRHGRVLIERDKASDVDHVRAMLLRKNALLPSNKDDANQLVNDTIAEEPKEFRQHAARLGWYKKRAFIRNTAALGDVGRRITIAPPIWLNDKCAAEPRERGSLKAWRAKIVRPADYSSLLRFVLFVAFGAMLLKFSGLQNFILNVFGPAKVGKTTALLLGASVGGIGAERDLPNWNSSSNSIAETARVFNDMLMPINEIGLLAGKKQDAYGALREQIYRFSEGRDRGRMSGHVLATSRTVSQWRAICVSTSEFSINEYAAAAGEERSDGEYARCIDVRAVDKGAQTIFDSRPPGLTTKKKAAWALEQLVKLRNVLHRNHGVALEPFVSYVIANREQVRARVKAARCQFRGKVRELDLDGALLHAGENFGLLYAAGCIAHEAKILPWDDRVVLDTVLRTFRGAIADVGGYANALADGQRILRSKLKGVKDLEAVDRHSTNVEAFFSSKNEYREVWVRASLFRKWFENPAQARAVIRWLFEEGLLVMGQKRPRPAPGTTRWAERTLRWSNRKMVRAFVFVDPYSDKS